MKYPAQQKPRSDRSLWLDMLTNLASGNFPTEQPIERLLAYLEVRT